MAVVGSSYISCGVHQLWDLTGMDRSVYVIKDAIRSVQSQRLHDLRGEMQRSNRAFIIYSDFILLKNGESLTKYIRENGLGEVLETEEKVNPNSENRIKVYVWAINHEALEKWEG